MKNYVIACVLSLVMISPALAQNCANGVCGVNSKPAAAAPVRVVAAPVRFVAKPVRAIAARPLRLGAGVLRKVRGGLRAVVGKVLFCR